MATIGYSVEFDEVEVPIQAPVSKFGGQPVWRDEATWPLSKTTGQPMTFICQICVPTDIFPAAGIRMAFLFMADIFGELEPTTWEPDSGDNGVIVQPGIVDMMVEERASGPTLERWYEPKNSTNFLGRILFSKVKRNLKTCEFATRLTPYESESERAGRDKGGMGGTKVGGTPDFIQNEEYPAGEGWRLLLQLDSARVPFEINFGDAGVGYLFLSADCNRGKFLWQCS